MAASSRFTSGDFATLAFAGGNGYRNSKYLEFIQIERQKSTTADRSIVENLPFSVEKPLFPVENCHSIKCDRSNPIDRI
ncbi:hypothetical protein QUB30_25095 [Microcoleus sp. BROC3]